jgi:hypothetical protein
MKTQRDNENKMCDAKQTDKWPNIQPLPPPCLDVVDE